MRGFERRLAKGEALLEAARRRVDITVHDLWLIGSSHRLTHEDVCRWLVVAERGGILRCTTGARSGNTWFALTEHGRAIAAAERRRS